VERGLRTALVLLAAVGVFGLAGQALAGGSRDDTKSLQRALDNGGSIVLRKLKNGQCYMTRGLWVSHNNTSIDTPDGACIQYLGPGPVRLTSDDGDPIPADAIFYVNRSSRTSSLPQHISIANLKLIVPTSTTGFGIVVAGADVTLKKLKIRGAPVDGIQVTGRANGRSYAGPVSILKSNISAARRNGISVVGAIGVTIDSNTISGAGNPQALGPLGPQLVSYTGPWAGIDVEPNVLTYPIRSIMISNNTIASNGGAGVLLALSTNDGLPIVADQITLTQNLISANAKVYGPFLRGGVCLQGGQADGLGTLTVSSNQIVDNGGWGLCKHPFDGFTMQTTVFGNVFARNELGDSEW
jgi:parallel beta helix pectate lyase-like protein